MTDTRISDRERRRAASLRANLARRKALARSLGGDDPAQAQAHTQAEGPQSSAVGTCGDGGVDGGDKLG